MPRGRDVRSPQSAPYGRTRGRACSDEDDRYLHHRPVNYLCAVDVVRRFVSRPIEEVRRSRDEVPLEFMAPGARLAKALEPALSHVAPGSKSSTYPLILRELKQSFYRSGYGDSQSSLSSSFRMLGSCNNVAPLP